VKPEAILYDLDDTLLVNPIKVFVPAYLDALTRFMAEHVDSQLLADSLLAAIRVMDDDVDPQRTNAEVFFEAFLPPLNKPRPQLEALFGRFYAEAFPGLRSLTRPAEGAHDAVQWAHRHVRRIAVATNPVFPETAINQRIRWAELEPEPFDLVTTLESSHATKAHPAYYHEVADELGVAPDGCVMVGDNWRWDVANPASIGMAVWWIAETDAPRPDVSMPLLGQGPLTDFVAFARNTWGE
jgi:FMN phosphatase YigB (HAD superfamily)